MKSIRNQHKNVQNCIIPSRAIFSTSSFGIWLWTTGRRAKNPCIWVWKTPMKDHTCPSKMSSQQAVRRWTKMKLKFRTSSSRNSNNSRVSSRRVERKKCKRSITLSDHGSPRVSIRSTTAKYCILIFKDLFRKKTSWTLYKENYQKIGLLFIRFLKRKHKACNSFR